LDYWIWVEVLQTKSNWKETRAAVSRICLLCEV
jgi:hypothetical protein